MNRLCQTGYIMSIFALVRAAFLTFAFPVLINHGRKLCAKQAQAKQGTERAPLQRGVSTYGTTTEHHDYAEEEPAAHHGNTLTVPRASYRASFSVSGESGSEECTPCDSSDDDDEDDEHAGYRKLGEHESTFDLQFFKWSCFLEACATAVLWFSSRGWHLYLGEFIRFYFVSSRRPSDSHCRLSLQLLPSYH